MAIPSCAPKVSRREMRSIVVTNGEIASISPHRPGALPRDADLHGFRLFRPGLEVLPLAVSC